MHKRSSTRLPKIITKTIARFPKLKCQSYVRRYQLSVIRYLQLFRLTLAPTWFPHWPAWRCTISLMVYAGLVVSCSELSGRLTAMPRTPGAVDEPPPWCRVWRLQTWAIILSWKKKQKCVDWYDYLT